VGGALGGELIWVKRWIVGASGVMMVGGMDFVN